MKRKAVKKPVKKKPVKKTVRRPVKKASKPTTLSVKGTYPPKTCPYCKCYPCNFDALTGSYRCPRCGKTF
jgi:hypothetical protein